MTTDLADTRTCETCNNTYLLTDAEREFRLTNNLPVPNRCPACRGRERMARNADLVSLYDQAGQRDVLDPSPGSARTGGRRTSRGNDRRVGGPRQMYNTVCANCGAETQVPFVPRGDRPVYCRDCYNARNGR